MGRSGLSTDKIKEIKVLDRIAGVNNNIHVSVFGQCADHENILGYSTFDPLKDIEPTHFTLAVYDYDNLYAGQEGAFQAHHEANIPMDIAIKRIKILQSQYNCSLYVYHFDCGKHDFNKIGGRE